MFSNVFHSIVCLFGLFSLSILIYHISSNFLGRWSKKKIKKDISVFIVTNEDQCRHAVSQLWKDMSDICALGFDCEWISQPKSLGVPQPISLLQLCSSRGFCCLFRLNQLGHIPSSLKNLLESDIVKLGVDCHNDAKLIQQNYNIRVYNFLDLRHLFSMQASLATLSETIIGVTLSKELSVICSNWNQKVLSSEQIDYAAKDAWVAVEIFKAWSVGKNKQFIKSFVERYANTPFKAKKNGKEDTVVQLKENFHPSPPPVKFTRMTPHYDNCWIHAPDGEVLCSCNKRKAHWYIEKGLAEVICQNPFSIRLLFEPKSRPGVDRDGEFYRQFKKNCCVVCGSEELCLKHYVLPREYRKHFPLNMKSHQSHDIVLTCLHCHVRSKKYMRQFHEELAQLCDAPIHVSQSSDHKKFKKLRNICRALLKCGSIPLEKKQELERNVKEFFGLTEINKEILQEICLQKIVESRDFVSHGEKVVEYFRRRKDGLIELEVFWRKKFIQNLKPQFLPTAWSVDHNHKKFSK